MLMRMTSDDPERITRHLNIFFAENGNGYIRSGGADNQDIELMAWIREAAKNIGAELCSEDDECLCDELYENLMYGIEIPEGVLAYLYLAVLQAIEMRGRLKKIEDILGEEYDLDRLRELVQADKEGRCVVLPCKLGNKVYFPLLGRIIKKTVYSIVTFSNSQRIYCDGTSEFFRPENFGKTVFLTRAAAEKALEEMEENENG